MTTFESPFALGDAVFVDEDRTIPARVIAIMFSREEPQGKISWFHNGALVEAWVAPWRLTPAQVPF